MKSILILMLLPCLLLAQPQQSANFRINKSVLDGGGGAATSSSFRLTSAYGQPSPLGWQSSANFRLSGGILSPILSVSPLSPIQDLVISYNAPDAVLHWGRTPGAQSYRIYRATDPLFSPSPTNLIGVAADTLYTDTDILSLTDSRYYYIITASSAPTTLMAKSGMQRQNQATRQMMPANQNKRRPDIRPAPNPTPPHEKIKK
jgi:hypothetical protein